MDGLRNILIIIILTALIAAGGCVERRLTVQTAPPGALVSLNDQQLGRSPVTVPFRWYGDYKVRIEKQGYQTLKTHRQLKAPWYDHFPFDFFAGVLWPKHIVDTYRWDFELTEKTYLQRDELIRRADQLRKNFAAEPNDIGPK